MATQRLLLDQGSINETILETEDDHLIVTNRTPGWVNQAVLDQNKIDRDQGNNRLAKGRHAARVPVGLRAQWRREWEANHSDSFKWTTYLVMKINQSDYKHLRTGVRSL